MNVDEATVLILACKPLSDKINSNGFNIELTKQDKIALTGFSETLRAGLHKDAYIQLVALRNNIDFLALIYMRNQENKQR